MICDLAAQGHVFVRIVLCIFPCPKRFQGLCIPIGNEGCGRPVGTPTHKRCSDTLCCTCDNERHEVSLFNIHLWTESRSDVIGKSIGVEAQWLGLGCFLQG